MPKVSVIVPVYNGEPYLSVCLESILAQTLKDIEIICIDDGSTDKSPVILDEYAVKDSRVHILHKENHGYGKAINIGMDVARGEYIGIVESDDQILPEMYESLYKVAKDHDLDFVKSDCIFWWENLGYIYEYHKDYLNEYYDQVLDSSYRRTFYFFLMNIWTGIYKKDFLDHHKIRCNETPSASYQDNGFWIQTMSFAEKVMWLSKAFYMYRQDNPASSIKSKDKAMSMKEEYDFAEKILEEKSGQFELELCHYYRMIRHKGVFFRISDKLKRDYCKEIVSDYEKYKDLMIQNKKVSDWLRNMYEAPEKFCDEFIDSKTSTLHRLEEAVHIIIYGAGNYGEKALRILSYQNMCKKILCFAVSDRDMTGSIGIIPIQCIDSLTEYRNNAVVIIGVKEHSEAYEQIRRKLKELKFEQVLDMNLLSEYFYYLK